MWELHSDEFLDNSSVKVFISLSGYCLVEYVAKQSDKCFTKQNWYFNMSIVVVINQDIITEYRQKVSEN